MTTPIIQSLNPIKESQKEKNILFLISSIWGGGAERVACRLVSEFSKRHKVYLMYFNEKNNNYFIDPKVKLIPFILTKGIQNKDKKISLKDLRMMEIEKVRRIYKIDITISFLYWPNIYNANCGGGTLKILSERNDPQGKGEEYFNNMKSAYEKADVIVFQTKYIRNIFPKNIQLKSKIIQNPISVGCLSDEKYIEKKIVSVGRLVPQKNHALLIKAFSIFQKLHNDYHLYIYGIGDLLEELKLLTEEKKVSNYVHFEGFSENVHEEIKNAEQFILSSDYEGMPNSLMEAMMMGLPCISTNYLGVGDIITDGINGLLVPKGDISALGRAMCRLSDDKSLQKKLRRSARIKSEEWKTERVIKKWEDLFFINLKK
jgi:glycosyltransferase involved in cell wall biosynthesis